MPGRQEAIMRGNSTPCLWGKLMTHIILRLPLIKAELSVELLVQLRNKALESYDQLIKIGF